MSRVCTDLRIPAAVVGEPAEISVLKDKPGRRRTSLVRGPTGTVVVKAYASNRALAVARRIAALASGPPEPEIPRVLVLNERRRTLVLSHVPGAPLTDALAGGDLRTVKRAGEAIGGWHSYWWGRVPAGLSPHPAERELSILRRKAEETESSVGSLVLRQLAAPQPPWPCPTVVHRDLYDTQVVVGERVGLIDLDDAACGPPELDVGNLLAHLTLLGLRLGRPLSAEREGFLRGYLGTGPDLERGRLDRCETLSLLRLACIHREPALLAGALLHVPHTEADQHE